MEREDLLPRDGLGTLLYQAAWLCHVLLDACSSRLTCDRRIKEVDGISSGIAPVSSSSGRHDSQSHRTSEGSTSRSFPLLSSAPKSTPIFKLPQPTLVGISVASSRLLLSEAPMVQAFAVGGLRTSWRSRKEEISGPSHRELTRHEITSRTCRSAMCPMIFISRSAPLSN